VENFCHYSWKIVFVLDWHMERVIYEPREISKDWLKFFVLIILDYL